MREIINKNFGHFYIEEPNNREEKDRVKLCDSEMNYLDYLPLHEDDDDETIEQQYKRYIAKLESFETIEEMLEWLVLDYEFVGFKDETIAYLHNELNWDLPSEEYNPLDNEWVNRIGNIYVVVSEY